MVRRHMGSRNLYPCRSIKTDLTKYDLPHAVEVHGRFFDIHTDHAYFIRFSQLIKDANAIATDFDFMYVGDRPTDRVAGLLELAKFANPPRKLPRRTSDDGPAEVVIDYTQDAELIYAAFMDCYAIDLYATPLHWHKFLALLHGCHDCKLTDVIGYRLYTPDGKNDDYSKRLLKLKEAWTLPQPEEPDEDYDDFIERIR